jgi:pimeloyl-ACP methyl ester carboxylesterase
LGVTDLVLAYTVTTQSTTKTLDMVAAETVAQPIAVAPTGKTPKDLNPALPANADIYIGTLKVPYYMATPADATVDNLAPTSNTYWKADAAKPDLSAKFLGKSCGAYATAATPSASTTICFPSPVKQSDQTIPVLVTVPKTAKPAGGWPVVIFQHGITRNRTDMLAVAPALAQAGFVTIAIDLPLHGLAPAAISANPLYRNQAFTGSPAAGLIANERTFDVDSAGEYHGAYDQVGTDPEDKVANKNTKGRVVASSGTFFINLPNPITSRDNLRQGAADIIVLAKSLANLDIDGGGADIDMTKVRFVSQSLGSIVGTVALGIDKAKVMGAASLSVGGGGIPKLLDASKSYGPIITSGLAAKGVEEGTDDYETFMRFAQTLADSGDPINYAATAYTNHPIHLTEVMDDLVVPNKSIASPATAAQDFVGISSFLSGTDPLAKTMGFVETNKKVVDMSTLAKSTATGSTWVLFNQGKHGSLLSPIHPKDEDRNAKGELDETTVATAEEKATFLAITTEMQCQTVSFVASNGAVLPIGCSKP